VRILATAALLFLCASAGAQTESLPPLPPLTDPPSNEHLPGKFVWADLFTNDVERARKFYEQVFDWDWRVVTAEPQHYGLLYSNGEAVAGIVHRDAPEGHSDYGRWVHFISTTDIRKTGGAIVRKGGEELLGYRNHAERGEFAIYAGPHREVFGIIRSSSGDPVDYQPAVGDWIWWQLFTRDVQAAVDYYQALFGYDAHEKRNTPGFLAVQLSAHGYARAAVGPLPDDAESSPNWIGFIRVGDMTRTLEKVVAEGGKVLLAPDPEMPHGDLAVISDPVGTLVGLLRWDHLQHGGEIQP
jgi:predicted enzyme related to lactoylglutathione lyase